MSKDPLKSPELYFNRELSWLEFNDRVLRQGLADDVPLMERLKFLAIVSSNLDEFFLVRVAGLMSAADQGRPPPRSRRHDARRAVAGHQRARASHGSRTGRSASSQRLAQLAAAGITIVPAAAWTDAQRQFLHAYFSKEIAAGAHAAGGAGPASRRRGCRACNGTWPCC